MAGENVEVWQYREQEKNHPDDGAFANQRVLTDLEKVERRLSLDDEELGREAPEDERILVAFNKRLDDPNHMTS